MKKCFAYQCVVMMMLLMAGVAFSGCDKLKDDMDGMNIPRADYLYRAMVSIAQWVIWIIRTGLAILIQPSEQLLVWTQLWVVPTIR